jgi:hypothetical protein
MLNNVYCATPLCNCPLQFGNQNVRLSSCQSFVGKKFPAAGLQSLSFAGPAGSPPPVLSLISKQVHPVASRSIFIGFVAFVQLRLLLYRKAYIGSTASSSTPPRIWRRLEHASDPAACPCFSAAATRQRPQDSAQQVRDGMPLIQRSGYAATRQCPQDSAQQVRDGVPLLRRHMLADAVPMPASSIARPRSLPSTRDSSTRTLFNRN